METEGLSAMMEADDALKEAEKKVLAAHFDATNGFHELSEEMEHDFAKGRAKAQAALEGGDEREVSDANKCMMALYFKYTPKIEKLLDDGLQKIDAANEEAQAALENFSN